MLNAWTLIGFAANVAVIVMAIAWAIARRVKNASCLEVIWSYGFTIIALLYLLIGPGYPSRKWLLAGMVTLWSLRLGTSLLIDLIRHHPVEGLRYLKLREQFPKRPWLMFFGFSQYLAALLTLLSAPFAIVCSNPAPEMSRWEIAGLTVWCAAVLGQSLAIFQLRRFCSDHKNFGKVCSSGLWRYSRHPDCFFEWLFWVAYFVFSLGSPWGWVTLYCPLLMFHLLTKVTGIPPAEARSLASFGTGYRHYQETTRAFFPGPRKPGL